MDVLADVFGFALASENKGVEKEILDKLVRSLIDERKAMRASKNFQRADEIREHLAGLGIILKDTPQDTEWSIQSSD
jgi:cysteinyl-tRNA synthetase